MWLYPDVIRWCRSGGSRKHRAVFGEVRGRSANLDAFGPTTAGYSGTLIVVNPSHTHVPLLPPSFVFTTFSASTDGGQELCLIPLLFLFLSFWITATPGIYCKKWPWIFSPKIMSCEAVGYIQELMEAVICLFVFFSHRPFVRDQAIDESAVRFLFSSVGPHVSSQSLSPLSSKSSISPSPSTFPLSPPLTPSHPSPPCESRRPHRFCGACPLVVSGMTTHPLPQPASTALDLQSAPFPLQIDHNESSTQTVNVRTQAPSPPRTQPAVER